MARPTIRDVAALAGVSTATVSYVLNGTGSVSEKTAERVRACVAELGYRPNSLAVAHRTGRSRTIGLAVTDLTNPFFPEFAQGVHRAAAAKGFAVFLVDAHSSEEDELEGITRLADRFPEGLIWVPVGPDIITDLDFPFPTVVFDREVEGFDSVKADIRRGGELQGEFAVRSGHERIGLISGPEWSDTAQLRRAGVLEGIDGYAEVVWEFPVAYSSHIPPDVVDEIAHANVTCAITANDIQAIGLMNVFRGAGLSVPDDVSVIGFDDIELASLVSPGLTTIHLAARRLGATAFDILCERIEDPDLPIRREVLPVSMTRRESLRDISARPARFSA